MNYQHKMVDALEHRSAAAFASGRVDFAYIGSLLGLVLVENGLDQNVSVQLQGRARGGTTWQNVGIAETVTAGSAGNISISEPWPELRIYCTPAGLPTSGEFNAWFSGV